MRRAISVWLPTFATDLVKRRLARQSPAPRNPPTVFLTRRVGGRELVERCCAVSQACGVAAGMDVAQARSLLDRGKLLHMEEARPAHDASALQALACWTLRFSPVVAVDGDDGLLMDVSGMERVCPDEQKLVRRIARTLARLGFAVRVALASTYACAWAVARYGGRRLMVVPAGTEEAALAPLPVDALGAEDACTAGLLDVGVETIADLAELPRHAVIARYGGALLERLDHAFARSVVPEAVVGVQAPPEFRAGIVFEGPTDHAESVQVAAGQVLGELVAQLASLGRGVRKLRITIKRPDAIPESVDIQLSRPSVNQKHLWKLVETRLERMDMGQGVEGVSMAAVRTARLRHRQEGSAALGDDGVQVHDTAMGEFIDTLVSRLGPQRVLRAQVQASHLPERSFRYVPVLEQQPTEAMPWSVDRPTLLFARPEEAQVMSLTPDGPVLSLRWRGESIAVIRCTGPEHIGPEWWRRGMTPLPDRAYYGAQTDQGRWLFLCRQVGTGNWFVQGEWA
ncbi:MAG: DNA polymerase Y family protein [Phycisphaerales bacterium]